MEEDSDEPRSCNIHLKEKIFNYYHKEMEVETERFFYQNENAIDVKFHLFQTIENKVKIETELFKVAYFYDRNYVGNKDFIQIPTLQNIVQNVTHYPILMASKKDENGNEDLLGVTTIKYENNKRMSDNPYFPTQNEDILSITGILTKLNTGDEINKVKNIGKSLFKAGIKGAYELNKKNKVRLICKIDCRNKYSFYGVCKAVKELQSEGMDVNLVVDGYYEIFNMEYELVEAPTFVLEIELNGNSKINNDFVEFSYLNCEGTDLLNNLANIIKKKTQEQKRDINLIENQIVIYHKIQPINALNVTLEIGNSADGNLRIPVLPVIWEPVYSEIKVS